MNQLLSCVGTKSLLAKECVSAMSSQIPGLPACCGHYSCCLPTKARPHSESPFEKINGIQILNHSKSEGAKPFQGEKTLQAPGKGVGQSTEKNKELPETTAYTKELCHLSERYLKLCLKYLNI